MSSLQIAVSNHRSSITMVASVPRHCLAIAPSTTNHARIPPLSHQLACVCSPLLSSLSTTMCCHGTGHVRHLVVVVIGTLVAPAGTHVCPPLVIVIVVALASTGVRPPLVIVIVAVDVVPPWHWQSCRCHGRRCLMHAHPYPPCRRYADVVVPVPCVTSSSSLLWASVLSLSLPPCIVVTAVVYIHRLRRRSYRHQRCHRHGTGNAPSRHCRRCHFCVPSSTSLSTHLRSRHCHAHPLLGDWASPCVIVAVRYHCHCLCHCHQAVPGTVYSMEVCGC